ncbi:MAG TPA: dihydrodipicolinate synthase family protein [Candidatus Limnocylindrales bacterium]|nr:dihydrodipicolinate synthase family protein [Candidatus Limnocylindrales bacterium]
MLPPRIYAAAITPRGKQFEIDYGAAFELIDFLCRAGVHGIALFTTAGEYGALRSEDRSRLVYLAVKRSRVPLLAGVGSATLDDSVKLGREARDTGAAGLLLPPPYFFHYEQDDLREFCVQFAMQVEGVPVYLVRTAALCADTAAALLATGRFAGVVEEAGGSFGWAKGHEVLAGEDGGLRQGLDGGASGAVSAAACAIPELVLALAGGAAVDELLREFLDWMKRAPWPVMLKAAVRGRGLKTGPEGAALSAERLRSVSEFAAWFHGWLPSVKGLSARA